MFEKARKFYLQISEKILRKTGFELIEIVFTLGCSLLTFLMFLRCFFGIEFTDEAFTVSDSLAVMHGNTPFAFDTLVYVGQSFIPIVFYKVYELFVPNLEGIFLYSRLCYVVFRLLILFIIYYLLRNDLERKWRILSVGILIPFMGSIIQNFSYNTISTYITLLVSVLLYSCKYDDGKRLDFKLFIAGFLSAISVFAHPVHVFAVFTFIVLVAINSRTKQKNRNIIIYCFGGIVDILIVFVPIIISVGLEKVLFGIETMITCGQDMITSTAVERIIQILDMGAPYWKRLIVVGIIAYLVIKDYVRDHGKGLKNSEYWTLAVGISVFVDLLYAKGIDFFYFAGMISLGACVLIIPTFKDKKSLIWYLLIPNICFIAFLTLFSLSGTSRFYYSVPLLLLLLISMFKMDSRIIKCVAAAIAVLAILKQGYWDFKYVYRDADISQLSQQVTEGVYKGIFTTPDRAHDVVELEQYLNENISEAEMVSFRDNVPVAYLMINKNICDVKTWDEMQWSYNCNDPTSMYRYYKNKGEIPDVIAYVDFGRDDSLSIENSSELFQFNDFVNEYYYLDKDDFQNTTFRVLIYRNNGTFNYDFNELIGTVR